MKNVKNALAISIAAFSSICLIQESGLFFDVGIAGIVSLIIMAVFSPWLGLLALFPLVLSIPPAPTSIGLPELSFIALLGVVSLGSLLQIFRSDSRSSTLKICSLALLSGFVLLSINLFIATSNNILLVDWIRGAIPFIFIYMFLPIGVLIGDDENKIKWVGASVGTLVLMLASYIIFYYFYYDVWKPYWIITTDAGVIKISEAAALDNLNAVGPMRDRITMLVAQATDALLPVGLVAGVILATLSRRAIIAGIGSVMALLCLLAILITFTRSMLLSPLLVLFLFALLMFFRKEQRLKLSLIFGTLATCSLMFIFATGMQDIWIGRISQLIAIQSVKMHQEAPEAPVASSSDESDKMATTAEAVQPAAPAIIPTATVTKKPDDAHSSARTDKVAADKVATKHVPAKPVEKTQATPKKPAENNKATPTKPVEKVKAVPTESPKEEPKASEPAVATDEPPAKEVKDFNISSRMEEYKIAWDMFLSHPILGNGLGIKHQMSWETTDGVFLTKQVGYVHNWIFYMLMVGGLAGFIIYSLVLVSPVLYKSASIKTEPMHWTLIRACILTMALYATFFAVFRLITFNLLIAVAWGIVFSQILASRQKVRSTDAEEMTPSLLLQR